MSTLQSEQDARIKALREEYRPPVIYTLFVAAQALAYVYFENEPGRRCMHRKLGAVMITLRYLARSRWSAP